MATSRQVMHRLDRGALVVLIGLIVASNIGQGAGFVSHLDLFAHFQPQYAVLLGVMAVWFMCRRRWWWGAVAIVAMLPPLVRIAPYFPGEVEAAPRRDLRVLSANVLWTNDNHAGVLAMVSAADADIVLILEATEAWEQAFADMAKSYPYRVGETLENPGGMLLLSRFPLEAERITPDPATGWPIVSARALVRKAEGELPLSIVGAHPIRPGLRHGAAMRDAGLAAVVEAVSQRDSPLVVIGDLNMTMWAPAFNAFVDAIGLRDPRRGRGIMPSWERMIPLLSRIPIDHCLLRGDVHVSELEFLEISGSDHLAICVDLMLGAVDHAVP